jgi:hypothetical protein
MTPLKSTGIYYLPAFPNAGQKTTQPPQKIRGLCASFVKLSLTSIYMPYLIRS